MKIDVLIDDPNSWFWEYHDELLFKLLKFSSSIRTFKNSRDIEKGDILFIISCSKLLSPTELKLHENNIVIHASNLPKGRGWSPWLWAVNNGENRIDFTLFEADENIDEGRWYIKHALFLEGSELLESIRNKVARFEISMIESFLKKYPVSPNDQQGEATFWPKRSSRCQELDINKTIKEQFNLLRVVDNDRYPAHFFIKINNIEHKFIVKIYEE